ncbi:hypothetical protein EDB81DRAFT_805040 [Dactylonectria macrodidyma]|uniref:NB-ARC domain-containing protein n=1 Tax=Dactylonectria macrodidyma TaxID=307937 RepID=A0A9P9EAB7_9HYPO|nr:hypothetical protein EDB81DRAFT_805040 [Dactylonectria macrodidyma]
MTAVNMAESKNPVSPEIKASDVNSSTDTPESKAVAIRKLIPKISGSDLGLKIRYQPAEQEDIEIDLVAVHGIGVDPKTSWVHQPSGVDWLEHESMLPHDLKTARIMSFNYDSVWIGDDAVKQSLNSVAKKLLNALRSERKDCPFRPLLLIGHCFGGLVIQKAYNVAVFHPDDWSNLSESITGMIFMGTPHQGLRDSSQLGSQGKIYAYIVESKLQIQDQSFKTMAQDNGELTDTVHDFTRRLQTCPSPPQVFCFFEEKQTKVGAIVGLHDISEFMVGERSGSLDGHKNLGLALNHFNLNKFDCNQNDHYRSVQRQINEMKEASLKLLHAREMDKVPPSPSLQHYTPTYAAPIKREVNFAPRGGVLKTIDKRFCKTLKVVLYGESGYGKTHIAVEYTHAYLQSHPGARVHWVNAASAEQLQLSYMRIAKTLNLSKESEERHHAIEAVHRSLKHDSSGAWLMIFDGLEKEAHLTTTSPHNSGKSLLDLLPTGMFARVLLTTRSRSLAKHLVGDDTKSMIRVDALKDENALAILGSTRSDSARTDTTLDLANTLDGSPGVLTLANSYMTKSSHMKKSSNKTSPRKYLQLIRDKPADQPSAAHAWALLHGLIQTKNPEAAELVLLISTLDVQYVPDILLSRHETSELIPVLEEYGIIEPSQDRRIIFMTALFRSLGQQWLAAHGKKASVEELTLHSVLDKFTGDARESLLPCALAVCKFKPSSAESSLHLATLMSKVSEYYMDLGEPKKALKPLEQCLSLREKHSDTDTTKALVQETKQAIENASTQAAKKKKGVSLPIKATRQFDEENQFLELEKSDAQWRDRNTVRTASDVAARRMAQGQYEGPDSAASMYQRVFTWVNSKEQDNPLDLARNQYNLALAQDAQGQHDNAEELLRDALQRVHAKIDTKKPVSVANDLFHKISGSLAVMYCAQGRFKEAEEAFRLVLPGQWKALGPNHPETLLTRHNFALLLQELGHYDKAAEELAQVLMAQGKLLGFDDPTTLQTTRSIALNLRLRDRFDDSKKLYKAVIKSQAEVLWKKHVDTVKTELMLQELVQDLESRQELPALDGN